MNFENIKNFTKSIEYHTMLKWILFLFIDLKYIRQY